MKILKVNKTVEYIVETDNLFFPFYRTNEDGSEWENLIGESWEPVYLGYYTKTEDELPNLFKEHVRNNPEEPCLQFKEVGEWIKRTYYECVRYDGKLWHRKYGDMDTINDLIKILNEAV